jgi:hypothetical protein
VVEGGGGGRCGGPGPRCAWGRAALAGEPRQLVGEVGAGSASVVRRGRGGRAGGASRARSLRVWGSRPGNVALRAPYSGKQLRHGGVGRCSSAAAGTSDGRTHLGVGGPHMTCRTRRAHRRRAQRPAAAKVKALLDQEGRDDLRLRIAVQPAAARACATSSSSTSGSSTATRPTSSARQVNRRPQ